MSSLAFLVDNWQFVVSLTLVILIFGVSAYMMRSWKIAAVGVAGIAMYFGGQALWTAGYKARVAEDVAKETQVLRDRINTMNRAAEADAKQALADKITIDQLEAKIHETPANSGACLDRDSARRVRDTR